MAIGQESPQENQIPNMTDGGARASHNDLWCSVTRPHDPSLVGFVEAAVRLAPISSLASEQSSLKHSQTSIIAGEEAKDGLVFPAYSQLSMIDLARYVFSWPLVSSPGVLALLDRRDKSMIFLLYEFYKAIKAVVPKNYWWAHQRAEKMISLFDESLPRSVLDPGEGPELAISEDEVARVAGFATESNEKWRQYCRVYAAASTTVLRKEATVSGE